MIFLNARMIDELDRHDDDAEWLKLVTLWPKMMLRILIGVALLVACAGPGRAQSYTAGYGTGNVIDTPLLEKTNGRYGYGGSVAPRSGDSQSAYSSVGRQGTSAYAYSPNKRGSMQSRHRHHSH
jgi:hypothetical protein